MSVISNEGDRLPVPSGARIIAAYVGNEPVFKSDIQGSVYKYEIETTDEEVRLVNFLGGKSNDWEGVETDIYIDWGDGNTYLEYGERLNTEKYNKDSKWKLTHQYQSSGQSHIITIKSVEPLMPAGCKVFRIDGTWPEDFYRAQNELLKYGEKLTAERPSLIKIQEHRQTIVSLGANLLDKWANTTSMYICFANWSALESIPDGFFKDNILSQCSSYLSCFSGCSNLKVVPDSLLGNSNNVVKNISSMFIGTAVDRHISLIDADSLTEAALMYQYTNVEEIRDDFLVNTPELTNVSGIFSSCDKLHDYHSNFLSNAPKLKNASSLVAATNVTEAKFNTSSWVSIEDMSYMFFHSYITTIDESFFSPNIASSSAKRLSIDGIFSHSNSETGLILTANVFKGFANRSVLTRTVSNIFTNSKIKSIEEGLFRDVFSDDNSGEMYTLTYLFSNSKSPLKLPNIFQGCDGVGALTFLFYNSTIDYLPAELFKDMVNLYSVKSMFRKSKINMIFRYNQFEFNKKITDWSYLFYEMTYKYADKYSIDSFIFNELSLTSSAPDKIDLSYMFYRSNSYARRMLNSWSDSIHSLSYKHCKTLNVTNFDNKPLLTSISYMFPSSETRIGDTTLTTDGDIKSYTITLGVIKSTTVALRPATGGNAIGAGYSAEVCWGDSDQWEYVEIPETAADSTKVIQHTYTVNGTYKIKIKSNALLTLYKDLSDISLINMIGDVPNTRKWSPSFYEFGIKYYSRYMLTYQNNISYIDTIDAGAELMTYNGSAINSDDGSVYYKYSEFVLIGDVNDLRLEDIGWNIEFPVKVEIIDEHRVIHKLTINSLDESLGSYTGKIIVRLRHSYETNVNSQPWINHRDQIIYIGGVLSISDFDKKFYDLAPNLERVAGSIFFKATDTTSMDSAFKNLYKFEHIPSLLCQRFRKVKSFKDCFMNTAIFRVPDRMIRGIRDDLDCSGMFRGCTEIKYVMVPIDDSCTGYINIDDMFDGVSTRCWLASSNDKVFERLWYHGDSKLGRHNDIDINVDIDNLIGYCSSDIGDSPDYIKASVVSWIKITTFNAWSDTSIRYADAGELFKFATDAVNSYSCRIYCGYLRNWNKIFKYLDRSTPTRYLGIEHGDERNNDEPMSEFDFFYAGKITRLTFNYTQFQTQFQPWSLVHFDGSIYPWDTFTGSTLANNQKMLYTLFNYDATDFFPVPAYSIAGYYRNVKAIDPDYSDFTLGTHKCYVMREAFYGSDIVPPRDFWGELAITSSTSFITISMFERNNKIEDDCGLFEWLARSLEYVKLSSIYNMFRSSSVKRIDGESFSKIPNIATSVSRMFENSLLEELPNIDNLSIVTNFAYFAKGTPIMSVPENYIKVTHNKAMTIDYMFADCPDLLVENKFIHPDSVMSSLSIDYALNDVMTTVGEDDVLFADFPYDATYENRSRVIYLNESNTFMQELLLTSDIDVNRTYTVRSVQVDDLVGHDIGDGLLIIVWGDGSKSTYVKNRAITEEDINHVYQAAGNYTVRIMATSLTAYVHTADYNTNQRIVSSFKYGTMADIIQKGMSKMFGFNVESIPIDLFYDLTDIDTISDISGCFSDFRSLSELPVGVFDKFVNVTNVSSLLQNLSIQCSSRTVLRKGIFDNLAHVTDMTSICRYAKIELEDGVFDKNVNVETIMNGFEKSLENVPVTIFHNMPNLSNVQRTFADCTFTIDDRFGGFFKHNPQITSLNHTFVGVKIANLPANMLEGLINLTNAAYAFSSGCYTDYVWVSGYDLQSSELLDPNGWTVPNEFFTHAPNITDLTACFAGRINCHDYGSDLIKPLTELNSALGMFYKCRLNEIHPNTISNKPTVGTLNIEYMFAKTHVTNCPKFIATIAKTVNTKNSLDTVCGYLSESELFEGVTTNPEDIQSGYRQEFEHGLILNISITSPEATEIHLIAAEPESFPWNGYVVEVDYGVGETIRLEQDISSQDELTELTSRMISAGTYTVVIKAPFLTYVYPETSYCNYIDGAYGKMITNVHTRMDSIPLFKQREYNIESDILYIYNKHITSLQNAYANCLCKFIVDDVFSELSEVTDISGIFQISRINVKDGYKPKLSHLPIISATDAFYFSRLNPSPTNLYDPLEHVTSLVNTGGLYKRSNVVIAPRTYFNNSKDLNNLFWLTGLKYIDVDYFDNCSNVSNWSRLLQRSQLQTVIGETEDRTLFTNLRTQTTSHMDFGLAFVTEGAGNWFTQRNIIRMLNNFGPFKTNTYPSMYLPIQTHEKRWIRTDKLLNIRIDCPDKECIFSFSLGTAKLVDISTNSIHITGLGKINLGGFNGCYTRREISDVSECFNIERQPSSTTDFESTGLKTLNSFDVTVNFDTPTKMKLEYVGGETITSVTYVELKIGDSDWQTFSAETPEELASLEFDVPAGETLILVSGAVLVMPVFEDVNMVKSVTGHMSNNPTNYVLEESGFSFGKYFGGATSFDINLCGKFYVKDIDGNQTLNGLFKDMINVTEYSESLFKPYYDSSTVNIVSVKSTFENNTSLNKIIRGQMQWLPHLKYVNKMYKNCALTEIPAGYFAQQTEIESWYEVFANNKLTKIPPKLIYVKPNK